MDKDIGEILISKGILDKELLNIALLEKREDQDIGDYLIENGLVEEDLFYKTLSEHFMISYIDLMELEVSSKAIDSVNKEILEEYTAFPVDLLGSMLTLAIVEPQNKDKIDYLSDKLELEINPVFAKKSDIKSLIEQYYNIDNTVIELLESDSKGRGDKNEINAVNKFSNIVLENDTVIASFSKSALGVTTNISNVELGRDREINYLVNFLLRTSGYDEGNGVYNSEIPYKDNLIHATLIIKSIGLTKEIWLEAVNINKGKKKKNINQYLVLDKGLYVMSNNKFRHNDNFIDSLLRIKGRVLIYTNDKTFENYGLKTFYDRLDLVQNYSAFADVFIFENGWSEGLTEPVLSLLNKGKTVILQLPFDKEMSTNYMELNNKSLSVLLEDIIVLN